MALHERGASMVTKGLIVRLNELIPPAPTAVSVTVVALGDGSVSERKG